MHDSYREDQTIPPEVQTEVPGPRTKSPAARAEIRAARAKKRAARAKTLEIKTEASQAPPLRENQPDVRERLVDSSAFPPGIAPSSAQDGNPLKTIAKAAQRHVWWLIYIVYLVGTIAYFGIIAKDRYVSTACFAVVRGSETAGADDALSFFMGSSPRSQDAYTAIAYLESIDMFRWIEDSTDLDFRGHFADAGFDIFHQLEPGAPVETAVEFFQDRVTAAFDDVEGLVTLEVDGYSAMFAKELCAVILERTEEYINELNREIADDSAAFLLEDLALSEEKLNLARQALLAFQNENLTVDPQADIQSRLELIQSLKQQKVFNQAERMRLLRESPNSPHIAVLESQIAALDDEMTRESKALTGEGPGQLNRLLATFSKLNQDLEFASGRYLQNLQLVEEIRLKTLSQHRYLSIVQYPFLPEDALKPDRLYWLISFAIFGFLAMQIIRLSYRTVADHA